MPSAVRVALEARLLASPGVTSLLATPTNVFHRRAPQSSRAPLVIIDKRSGIPNYRFVDGVIDRELWVVKAVAYGRKADRAEELSTAIDVALTNAPLVLTGRHLLAIYRESDIDYPEQVGNDLFQHAGGVYVVISQPS